MTGSLVMRRVLMAVTTAIAASFVLFLLLDVGPDPLALLTNDSDLSAADAARLAHQYGWDQPFIVQWAHWLGNLLRGDLGISLRSGRPAAQMILERVPLTLAITLSALALSMALSVPIALVVARRAGSRIDTVASTIVVAMAAVPGFLIAILLQLGAVHLKSLTGTTLLHVSSAPRTNGIGDVLGHLVLPVVALGLLQTAGWVRYQRAALLETIGSEFVTGARAKGLRERSVLIQHVLRASLAPIVTLVALDLGTIVGGSVVIELVFALPGLGRLLIDSVEAHDVVVVLDIVMLQALAIVTATTVSDLVVRWLDPRAARM
ncbi:MAG: ABC transporter permease [Thermoleophilia bacterium]|nr:ABC transporter permease [Thermoleophilia bacterium]